MSAAGALNFQLVAKLSGASAGMVNSVAGNLMNTAAPSGIPVTVTGTTSNPSIHANVASMVKQEAGGLLGKGTNTKSGVEGAVQGILHK